MRSCQQRGLCDALFSGLLLPSMESCLPPPLGSSPLASAPDTPSTSSSLTSPSALPAPPRGWQRSGSYRQRSWQSKLSWQGSSCNRGLPGAQRWIPTRECITSCPAGPLSLPNPVGNLRPRETCQYISFAGVPLDDPCPLSPNDCGPRVTSPTGWSGRAIRGRSGKPSGCSRR